MSEKLVTLNVGSDSVSNTYVQYELKLDEVLLCHPMLPSVFIVKQRGELDSVSASPRNAEERQLSYCNKYRKYLDFDNSSMLDALILYHIVYKKFGNKQKSSLNVICGKIAEIYCDSDLERAIDVVNSNEALLNSYNAYWYRTFERFFKKGKQPETKQQRDAIFNMAGFVLAQVS